MKNLIIFIVVFFIVSCVDSNNVDQNNHKIVCLKECNNSIFNSDTFFKKSDFQLISTTTLNSLEEISVFKRISIDSLKNLNQQCINIHILQKNGSQKIFITEYIYNSKFDYMNIYNRYMKFKDEIKSPVKVLFYGSKYVSLSVQGVIGESNLCELYNMLSLTTKINVDTLKTLNFNLKSCQVK